MKIFVLTTIAVAALSAVEAIEQASIHLRVHSKDSCTITNESQCNGQNWTGSTCCADSSYECRWSDDGQNVQRCQKKYWDTPSTPTGTGTTSNSCTITNESQCNGQNWTGSTCCADSSYECRWSDDGQNVQRCQKKYWKKQQKKVAQKGGSCTITNESQCNGQNWTGSTCCADSSYECRWSDDGQNVQRCQKKKGSSTPSTPAGAGTKPATPSGGGGTVGDWGDCNGGKKCQNPSSVCVKHSNYYSQCKPATLPAGALCGQNDGTNVWKYDKCPSNQKCAAMGSDFRCSNKKHHKKVAQKGGSCTITNESQCNGQNWTGSTCCADSSYECRWSDDGQNVQRCQKKKWKKQHKEVAQKADLVTDYPTDEDAAGDYVDNTLADDYEDTANDYDDTADDYSEDSDSTSDSDYSDYSDESDYSEDSDSTSDSDYSDYSDVADDYTDVADDYSDLPDDDDNGNYRA